jgi:hypothetical protein
MTKFLAIGLVLFGLATPVRQCVPPVPQGEHKVYVPYYSQEMYYWCVPACIKMWANYYGDYYTQSQIWNWARSWYSGEVIPGVGFTSLRSVTRTATNFVGRPVSEFRYVGKLEGVRPFLTKRPVSTRGPRRRRWSQWGSPTSCCSPERPGNSCHPTTVLARTTSLSTTRANSRTRSIA